jgi:hypothetical protein
MTAKSIIRMSGLCFLMATVARHGRRCKNALDGVFAKKKLRSVLLAGTLTTLTACASGGLRYMLHIVIIKLSRD